MKHKILPIILQYLPQKQKAVAIRQFNYFESQIDFWGKENRKKFKFNRDEISLLLQAAIFYQFIFVSLEDSVLFFKRMQKYEINKIKVGELILTADSIFELIKLSQEFKRLINSFFSSHNLDLSIVDLGFEDINVFIQLIEL